MKHKSMKESAQITTEYWRTYVSSGSIVPGTEGSSTGTVQALDNQIGYTSGHDKFNTCRHVKFKQVTESPLRRYRRTNTVDSQWNWTTATGTALDRDQHLQNCLNQTGVSSFDWENFAQRAIEAMTPSMESGFSLANFLYEIRDIKMLAKWWRKGKSAWRNFSSGTLNYSFGLIPFYSDMKRLYSGLTTLQDRLLELKIGAGKLQTRRYSEETDGLDWHQMEPASPGSWENDFNHVIPGIKFTAVMRYTYQLPDLDRLNSKLYQLLDTLGVQLNAGIVWEAIPYSFVVDWFFNVGDFLNQFREQWIPVNLYIKEFGCSAKFTCTTSAKVRSLGKVNSDWFPKGGAVLSYYHRFPYNVEDALFGISSSGSLTFRKFFLGGLLIEQRIH